MKAIVQDTYGSAEVMQLRDIDEPEIGEHELLIQIRAASVNPADWAIMSGLPYIARPVYGLRKPKNSIRGTDVAGTVEAVGTGVTRFKPGDDVFGWADGSYAEYTVAAEDALALKPPNLTFEQAAAVPESGQVALQALARSRQGPARPEGLDQRGFRRHRHLRGTDRQGLRRRRHGCREHAQPGPDAFDRCRSCRRLHAGGLHPERAAVRLHPRQRGQPLADRPPPRIDPDRDARAERRRVRQSLVRQRRAPDPGDRAVPLRQPATGAVRRVAETRRIWRSSKS